MKRIVEYLFIAEIKAESAQKMEELIRRLPHEVSLDIAGGDMTGMYSMRKAGMYAPDGPTIRGLLEP